MTHQIMRNHRPSPPMIFPVMISMVATVTMKPAPALAHATGQSFVALLPTGPYMAVGVMIVALSILLLWFLPHQSLDKLLPGVSVGRLAIVGVRTEALQNASSFAMFLWFCWLLYAGYAGTRDPLENPLVLGFWVAFWMAALMVQGLVFNLWGWISPWRWLIRPIIRLRGAGKFTLPWSFGAWPAVILLLCFSAFTLADPAPDDPARLASIGLAYLFITIAGMMLCGPRRWLTQVEFFTVVMTLFGRLAPLGMRARHIRLGWHGWQLGRGLSMRPGLPVFILVLLGTGSFDGFNETFVWLDFIGINPLAFPGRSAVVIPVICGLAAGNVILVTAFAMLLLMGDRIAGERHGTSQLVATFAPTILPIALAYHTAHYLPSLLVDGQYVLAALNDPFSSGANLLGRDGAYVTTGFFNHRETMRVIWLSQALIIVCGHVLAVVLAHAQALHVYRNLQRAFIAGMPLAIFMILYTWLGLWLLAAPKGG
jgi:hypothetical protein